MAKIGVFDSGIGGLAIADALTRGLPGHQIVLASDQQHMPYGDKPPREVLGYVLPLLQDLVRHNCQLIVVACNTVTTTLITQLRQRIPVPLIGIEPMVKPAALATKTGVIAVCATPATLASARYLWLKTTYAPGVTVLEPDCNRWAYMIEHNRVNKQQLRAQIDELCRRRADVIVLGCTHYHWVQKVLQAAAGQRAQVIQPEQAIVARVKTVLAGLTAPAPRQ